MRNEGPWVMPKHIVSGGWTLLFALVPLVLAGSACARSPGRSTSPAQRDYTASVQVGALARTYIVHLPSGYDGSRALPVVLCFHGGGGSGVGMNGLTHFNSVADQYGFIVVYPDGYQKHWADGRGTSPAEHDGVDDLAFINALLDQLTASVKADTQRIYATGISNGGFFSARLGCELSSRIAAIGVVAATLATNEAAGCAPPRPVSMTLIHGTDDPIVPSAGGELTVGDSGEVLSVDAAVAKWTALDGCMTTPDTSDLPDIANDGTRIQRQVYGGCAGGSAVINYVVEGGGHTWPGGLQYLPESIIGKTSHDMDASVVLWDFFQAHPMTG
jgi:polyhydroxybutyrate depolymerase